MRQVQRRMLIHVDNTPARVATTSENVLGLQRVTTSAHDSIVLSGPLVATSEGGQDNAEHTILTVTITEGHTAGGSAREPSTVSLEATTSLRVPYFHWLYGRLLGWFVRRRLQYSAHTLVRALDGEPAERAPRRPALLPHVRFETQQINLLATVCALGAFASFGGALFGQNSDSVARSFDISDTRLGTALALTRIGAILALVAISMADRRGRRVVLTTAFVALCIANGLSAVAPNFAVFTFAQLFARAAINSITVVAAIAVVEEAPDGARAFAVTVFGLASGMGYALSVILLPLADLGSQMWRISFVVSALSLLALPAFRRTLHETRRFTDLAALTHRLGRFREVFDDRHGRRFALLAGAAFLTNVFSAPSSQLTSRYLIDVHDFSNTGVAALRAITNGLPGLIGVIVGGRLAESRGRRPVAVIALIAATLLQVAFFLSGGIVLWVASTMAIVAAGAATLAVGTIDVELFPTEIRGTSNALLLICYVAGSAVGLTVAGVLSDPLGGIGRSIALCAIGPMLAAVFLLPRVPESAHRPLDEVSPPEI